MTPVRRLGRPLPTARVLALLGPLVFCLTSPLQAERPSEYEVKAAFLFNFAKFVEWPGSAFPDTNSPLTVCILGDAPFGEAFAPIQGQTVRGRRLRVERHQKVDGLVNCHILFISAARTSELPQVLRRLGTAGTLIVGEQEGFARTGGMISFSIQENRVQFEINLEATDKAGLKLSSRLLRLASIVDPPPDGAR
jgi:hypothetical protein